MLVNTTHSCSLLVHDCATALNNINRCNRSINVLENVEIKMN